MSHHSDPAEWPTAFEAAQDLALYLDGQLREALGEPRRDGPRARGRAATRRQGARPGAGADGADPHPMPGGFCGAATRPRGGGRVIGPGPGLALTAPRPAPPPTPGQAPQPAGSPGG